MSKRITLNELIEVGIITPPFKIHASYKGHDFTAEIDHDGFILLEGKRHTSLSLAAGWIRARISGKPADGLNYRRTNGWTFWKYNDGNGKRIPINSLRKLYIQ